MIETSKALFDLFFKYTHLPIGGKEIVCPYWMNDLKNEIYGPFGGKGTPEEIVQATEEEATKNELELGDLTEDEIIQFMQEKKIGVDCSGFVFWMLDALDREKGGNGIADDIPGSEGKYIKTRANVLMLTDPGIVAEIKSVDKAKPGDIVRLKGGKHILVVLSLHKTQEGEIERVEYAHSSDLTKIRGVHSGEIQILDKKKGLESQRWLEETTNGENYGEVSFKADLGDGIRRLKIWS